MGEDVYCCSESKDMLMNKVEHIESRNMSRLVVINSGEVGLLLI